MEKIDSSAFTATKLATLAVLREQDGCLPFKEMPSDKYDQVKENVIIDKSTGRITGLDLFLLFTADIIKQKVLFIR